MTKLRYRWLIDCSGVNRYRNVFTMHERSGLVYLSTDICAEPGELTTRTIYGDEMVYLIRHGRR